MERGEFENLVRTHWGLIQSVARRFASGADLADVCQEVVLVAWRRRHSLLPERSYPHANPSLPGYRA